MSNANDILIEIDPGNRPTLFKICYNEQTYEYTVWQRDMNKGKDYISQFTIWPPMTS